MSDKGIIFSAPMIRALLDGRKTQTRRLLKDAPKGDWHCDRVGSGLRWVASPGSPSLPCLLPFASGDRLYVREAWRALRRFDSYKPRNIPVSWVHCEADEATGDARLAPIGRMGKLRPSIFMPRWASRLWLEVRDVRVERITSISEADALAEGIDRIQFPEIGDWGWPQRRFADLWTSLHTKPGERWQDNPWVVAVTFDVLLGNIDQ